MNSLDFDGLVTFLATGRSLPPRCDRLRYGMNRRNEPNAYGILVSDLPLHHLKLSLGQALIMDVRLHCAV